MNFFASEPNNDTEFSNYSKAIGTAFLLLLGANIAFAEQVTVTPLLLCCTVLMALLGLSLACIARNLLGIGLYLFIYVGLYSPKILLLLTEGYSDSLMILQPYEFKTTLTFFVVFLLFVTLFAGAFRTLLLPAVAGVANRPLLRLQPSSLKYALMTFSVLITLGVFLQGRYSYYINTVAASDRALGGVQFLFLYDYILVANFFLFGRELIEDFFQPGRTPKASTASWFGLILTLAVIYQSRRLLIFVFIALFFIAIRAMSRQGKRISLGLLWVLIALMPLLFVGNSIFRDALRYDEVRSVSHSIERISNDFEDIDRDALEKHTGGIVDRLTYFTFDTFVSHLNERGFTPPDTVWDVLKGDIYTVIPAVIFPDKYTFKDNEKRSARVGCDDWLTLITLGRDNPCSTFNAVLIFPDVLAKALVVLLFALGLALGCVLFCNPNNFLMLVGAVFLWRCCMQIENNTIFPFFDGLRAIFLFGAPLVSIYVVISLVRRQLR